MYCVSYECMTHVESGSLSLFPKPGILKALARLFLLFSDTREDRYSSNPTGPYPHTYNTVFNESLEHSITFWKSLYGKIKNLQKNDEWKQKCNIEVNQSNVVNILLDIFNFFWGEFLHINSAWSWSILQTASAENPFSSLAGLYQCLRNQNVYLEW